MNLKDVKARMNWVEYYDIWQVNYKGRTIKEFIVIACILRKDKNNRFYYQTELKDSGCKNSVLIEDLEKVKTKDDI